MNKDNNNNNYNDDPIKQGSKCFGCCCDMRRAVIVVDIIQIVLSVIGAFFAFSGRSVFSALSDLSEYDFSAYESTLRISGIVTLVGIFFYAMGIVGASIYNMYLVGLAALWYVAGFIIGVVLDVQATNEFNNDNNENFGYGIWRFVFSGVIAALFIYPHVGLISEIKSGTMSADTYPRERYSCCCV
jgi:hypothetical protein